MDGTLIEAALYPKNIRPKERPLTPTDDDLDNPSVDFPGERWSNVTHASTTDPKARLLCKKGAKKPGKRSWAIT